MTCGRGSGGGAALGGAAAGVVDTDGVAAGAASCATGARWVVIGVVIGGEGGRGATRGFAGVEVRTVDGTAGDRVGATSVGDAGAGVATAIATGASAAGRGGVGGAAGIAGALARAIVRAWRSSWSKIAGGIACGARSAEQSCW